jgi:dTDP-4-amino-4,6-dideoxygalactose transaminase
VNIARVPFIDLARGYAALEEEITRAMAGVCGRARFILGEEVSSFEAEFARWVGSRFAVSVSNGTDALTIALMSLGVGQGHEVITAANTAIPTLTGIVRAQAVPVLVDAGDDYCIDPGKIARAITSRTRAIIPVHLYGHPCDMEKVMEVAKTAGLRVVEDCAQAHGARIGAKKAGTFGDAGCFSFYPTKNLGAYGDGGMIVTDSEESAAVARMIRHHGQSAKDVHDVAGMCARLDEVQAAILRVKLRHLDEWNARRADIARAYTEKLRGVVTPPGAAEKKSVWHLYVVRHRERDRLRQELARRGIETVIHYPTPAHLQKAFLPLGYRKGDFPISESFAGEILSLPMFPELANEEVSRVIDVVNGIATGK